MKDKEKLKKKKLVISGNQIDPGQQVEVHLEIARLPSRTAIDIPVFINRAQEPGPVLLILGGLHGDEINGIEIIRRIMEKNFHQPDRGTVMVIPILNIFGFIHFSREVPDGKDVNRSFPGFKNGSLAGRVAHTLMNEIIPHIDFGIDFHTGGASRSNYPQIRTDFSDPKNVELATAFKAPFTIHSNIIEKSLRHAAFNLGKRIIVFEGGESLRYDEYAIKVGINGFRHFLDAVGMKKLEEDLHLEETVLIKKRNWVRAMGSGLFRPYIYNGSKIEKGQPLGIIAGPYGDYSTEVISPKDGFVIGLNNNPVVNQGDALLHIGA